MDKFLSIKSVSEKLEVSEKTLYRWTKLRQIPHVRLPKGTIRFSEAVINSWLDKRKVRTQTV